MIKVTIGLPESAEERIATSYTIVLATSWEEFSAIPAFRWAHAGLLRLVVDSWRAQPHLADTVGILYIGLGWATILRPQFSQIVAQCLGFDPATAGRNWRGASLRGNKVAETIRMSGGSAVQIAEGDTAMAWCRARKAVEDGR